MSFSKSTFRKLKKKNYFFRLEKKIVFKISEKIWNLEKKTRKKVSIIQKKFEINFTENYKKKFLYSILWRFNQKKFIFLKSREKKIF